jgi:tripartite-type tricarboxylate transporter receptor subunit TctC
MTTSLKPLDPFHALLPADCRGQRLSRAAGKLDRRRTLLALAATAWSARAQTPQFPTRAISLLLPFGPGGIADLTVRAVAQSMSASLGQALVVDNRPSAGSIVASQVVANAAPDGHTLLLLSNGHAVAVSLFRKLPFDLQKDFAPVCLLASFDLALFVVAGSRFKTLTQLLDEARARPGQLTLGSVAVGSTQHLAAEWLKQLSGIDALVVPYKSTPAVLGALRSGEIDAAFEIIGPWSVAVCCVRWRRARPTTVSTCRKCPRWRSWAGRGLAAVLAVALVPAQRLMPACNTSSSAPGTRWPRQPTHRLR